MPTVQGVETDLSPTAWNRVVCGTLATLQRCVRDMPLGERAVANPATNNTTTVYGRNNG